MIGLSEYEKELICKELNIAGIKSIILIGSRARGAEIGNKGDYDVYAVLPTWRIPFIYRRIKEKERRLEHELGAEVSVNPLAIWRIRRGKDLLLFKTKKEGLTICGTNYLPLINIDNINDISPEELFSYLFSSMYFLMEHFDPLKEQFEIRDNIIYNAAKSVTYCAELQLFMNGIYEKERKNILIRVKNEIGINKEILDSAKLAQMVMDGDYSQINDLNGFWFSARAYILLVFQQLAERFLDVKNKPIENLIEIYKQEKRSFIKNLQYFVLVWIEKRKYPLFSIFTKKSIEKYLYCSLFYLMLSIEDESSINERYLKDAYQTLDSIHLLHKGNNNNKMKLWREVKNIIMEYWPMTCGKSII